MADVKTEVLAANEAFYRAMRRGDLAAMDLLWSEARDVSCAHPGRALLHGRGPVLESWRLIFEGGGPPGIEVDGVHAVVTGGTALVLCVEVVAGARLTATNAFALEDGRWRLVSHLSAEMPEAAG
jgi:hypothetical protein